MAKHFTVTLTDDVTGETLGDDGHTVDFTWIDGKRRQLDLTNDTYNAMIEAMAPYVDAAQILTNKGAPVKRTRAKTGTKEIRSWARRNGYEVSDRGRIPDDIVQAYEAAA